MKEKNGKIELFENICSRFSTWVIEYRSSTYACGKLYLSYQCYWE
jgi:hypothetical protein